MTTPLTIRNNLPIVGWVFGGLWIGGLMVFTYLYARDGGFGQLDPLIEAGVMLAFWMGALVLFPETLAVAVVELTVVSGGAVLGRRWPWKYRVEPLTPSAVRAMEIRQDRDSDGDPYYRLVLAAGPHEEAILSESAKRETVEAVRDQILAHL